MQDGDESQYNSNELFLDMDLDQDDLDYYREKAKMKKIMNEEDYKIDQNWWDVLPTTDPYKNTFPDDTDANGEGSSSGSRWPRFTFMPESFTSFMGSMIPSMAWGFGGKSPDAFSDDPFFENFRSLGNGRSLSSSRSGFRLSVGKSSVPKSGRAAYVRKDRSNTQRKGRPMQKNVRTAKGVLRRKNPSNKYRLKHKRKPLPEQTHNQSQEEKFALINIDDPVERFQLAIEVGKKLDDPQHCEYVFNGCPFSYEEIVSIIDLTRRNAEGVSDKDEEIMTEVDQRFLVIENDLY
jgi:hypothetical protein